MSVTYFSTDGIVLHSKSFKETSPTDKSVAISFTPQNPYIDEVEKNIYDFQEDKVIMFVSFWNNEEISHTESVDLSILYTPYGTFVSDIDPILSKRNYCRYLLSNNFIDEATYEDLNVMFHCYSTNSSSTLYFTLSEYEKAISALEKQNISAKTLSTNVRYGLSSFSPTLSWTAPVTSPNNENGFVFNYQYSVAIVSVNPAYVYISPAISSTSFTIPTDVWVDIIENCTNGFYWTIITDEVTDPTSGGYYSKFYSMKYQPKELDIPSRNRYTEDRAYVSSGKCYDYRVTFRAGGNKVVQTFGLKDTVLELYSSDGTLLLGRVDTDDKGYEWNSLFSYNFTSNTEYIIRVRFYATNVSGAVKLAIVPTYSHADYNSAYGTYSITTVNWKLGIDKVALFRYKFATAGDVTFTMSAQKDTYLYVLDPSSTELITEYDGSNSDATNLYDDDSGGDLQAQLTKTVEADIEYLVIISFYNPHTSSGDFSINTRYAS